MKAEDYRDGGYKYEDYTKLSQVQRWREFWYWIRKRRHAPHACVLVIIFWPLRCWRLGIDQSQEFTHFGLGPFDLQVGV